MTSFITKNAQKAQNLPEKAKKMRKLEKNLRDKKWVKNQFFIKYHSKMTKNP